MNKFVRILIIHSLFCVFIMNFIKKIFFHNSYHILHIFITYTISAVLLFVYQRWIDKKILPHISSIKCNNTMIFGLLLAIADIMCIVTIIITIINIFTYIIKICDKLAIYNDELIVLLIAFHYLIFITVSGMTINGIIDIKFAISKINGE